MPVIAAVPIARWTATDLAYLAGIVDGEGSIGIARWCKPARGLDYQFHPFLRITNTSSALLEWIQARFPIGGATYREQSPSKGGRFPVYVLAISNRGLKELIEALLPHLVIKRAQAELLLSFPRPSDTWRGYRGDGKRYNRSERRTLGIVGHRDQAMYTRQLEIFEVMRIVNSGGGKSRSVVLCQK